MTTERLFLEKKMQLNKRHVHVKTGDMVLCVFLQHLMTSLVPGVEKGIIFFADFKLVEKQHDVLISGKKKKTFPTTSQG